MLRRKLKMKTALLRKINLIICMLTFIIFDFLRHVTLSTVDDQARLRKQAKGILDYEV